MSREKVPTVRARREMSEMTKNVRGVSHLGVQHAAYRNVHGPHGTVVLFNMYIVLDFSDALDSWGEYGITTYATWPLWHTRSLCESFLTI